MHFHLEWSRPTEAFDHGGYYAEDGWYRSVGHQQDRRAPRQENRIVRIPKPDGQILSKTSIAPGQQHRQWVPKVGSSADASESSQGQTRPRSEASTNDEMKPDVEKGPEEMTAE
jgi:hypothetical protein